MKSRKNNLSGSVAAVRTEQFETTEVDGQFVTKFWYAHEVTYNTTGNITSTIHFNPDGSRVISTYIYDDTGERLLEVRHTDKSGNITGRVTYTFDAEGRRTSETQQDANGVVKESRHTWRYDANGLKTEILVRDLSRNEPGVGILHGVEINGEQHERSYDSTNAGTIETIYNAHDNPTTMLFYDADDKLLSRVEYRYDEQNRLIEETAFIGDVSPAMQPCSIPEQPPLAQADTEIQTSTSEEQAPTPEQLAEAMAEFEKLFAPGSVMWRQTYTYNDTLNREEQTGYMMDRLIEKRIRTFDDHGHVVEETSLEDERTVRSEVRFERVYDEHGNWTCETVLLRNNAFEDFRFSNRQTRAITYR